MKRINGIGLVLLFAISAQVGFAGEDSKVWRVYNRLRVEWDDNIRQETNDKDSSFKIIEEIEFDVSLRLGDNTFSSLRYRPSLTWWDDRSEDDSDFHHSLDFVLKHTLTPQLSFDLTETFLQTELPELIERGVQVRDSNDYTHNTVAGNVHYKVNTDTALRVAGRHILLRYDDSDVSSREDFDLYVIGLTLAHQWKPGTSLNGELRYEDVDYDSSVANRGTDGIQVGVRAEHTFSPNLLGDARLGWQHKEFDNAAANDAEAPYVDASVTVLPSPSTRLSLGGGFSQHESAVFPFANQERTTFYARLAHDLTARVAYYVSGTYVDGEYDSDEAAAGATATTPTNGNEEFFYLTTKLAYKVNRLNTVEAAWQYTDFQSDFRNDFDRSLLNIGWKTKI
ncbi:MAG: outer membrane beta-barrel protein [Kiritimatiellae bacterium]|nr:outer membrane beta-barrel protein [Kiritimatiellia bacterium]